MASSLRSQIYAWFSTVFARELSRETMRLYLAGEADDLMAVFSELGLEQEVNAVVGVFKDWARHDGALLENSADFATLFLLEGENGAIPYASYYLDDNRLLHGKSAALIRSFLASNQLRLDEQFNEPEDHISVILALMSRWAKAGDSDHDAAAHALEQASFIETAMLSWLNAWQGRMRAVSTLAFAFYPAVGALLIAFLYKDLEYLQSFDE